MGMSGRPGALAQCKIQRRYEDLVQIIVSWRIACAVLALVASALPSIVWIGPACAQDGGKRVALLIANGTYPDANLPTRSAAKDAAAFADELKLDLFDVVQRQDVTKQDMQAAIDAFLAKIAPGTTALFYFTGIGIQVAHQTFLIPVSAEIWSESDVKREGVSIDAVVNEMNQRGAKVKIVIIDASRRNPFERRFRTYSAGLAGIDAPEGTLVMFAAAPNKVGRDSTGNVTLFMSELVKELRAPGISVEEAMTHTRIGVSRASGGEEVPWVASSLVDPLYFSQASRESTSVASAQPPAAPAEEPVRSVAPKVAPAPSKPAPPQKADPSVLPPALQRPAAPLQTAAAPSPPPVPPKTSTPPASTAQAQVGVARSPTAAAPAEPSPGAAIRDCAECPEVVVLAAGDFLMGSGKTPFDRPVHKVLIEKPFAIGRTEVTVADWDLCLAEGGCKYRPDDQGFGGGDHPVINISWFDTKDYLAWLSKKTGKTYRLPSEAEWEYAARGGTTTAYSWGNSLGSHAANCSDCGNDSDGRQTLPARSFKPNGYGLYDMAGNAAEWVEDCWNLSYRGAPKDASPREAGSCGQRVLRGGSFDTSAAYAKPSARFRYDADVRYWANGFRVVREVP